MVTFSSAAGEISVQVEIARSAEQRARGLMHRDRLLEYHGMLFVFADSDRHRFWMKNTLISLDIIFIDDNRKVVGVIADTPPLTLHSQQPSAPYRYAVEVNAGFAARHRIAPGTPVHLP